MQAVTITQITPPELEELIEKSIKKVLAIHSANKAIQLESEQLLTIQQAGELLNLSVATLYGYTQRAEIPVCKKAKRLYFSKKDLLEWIKQGRKKTVEELKNEAETTLKKRGGIKL